MQRNLLIFILFSVIVISIFTIYTLTNLDSNDGEIVMPLDDVYIHFQYARQLAQGQPYTYNSGEMPTSGATSFIYPYILAVGYSLGFQGLNLGFWAMMVGSVALLGAMWAIFRLCFVFEIPTLLATSIPIAFAVTGFVSWHAMSGMETILIVVFTLWTLLAFVQKRLHLFIISTVLLALTRPEGSIMVGIVVVIFGLQFYFDKSTKFRLVQWMLLGLPIVASGIQPMVNYLITGSFSASGSQAKSLLGLIPKDWNIILSRIIENFVQLWGELFMGYSPSQDLWYIVILTVPLGLLGLGLLVQYKQYRTTVLLSVLWMVAVSLAISTLDTAFWHFKRYQLPLIALFIPFFAVTIRWLSQYYQRLTYLLLMPYFLFASLTFVTFLETYQLNIAYVRQQPLAMARWLAQNTLDDAIIAVHDVGMMRYIGERTTLDIVGLTTPDSAQSWRNGVGSVAEFLLKHQPDYIASYGRGHGYGLYMLADTRLYGEPLAEFTVDLDAQKNVALAANTQAIYQPDWDAINSNIENEYLLDVNVANINSERLVHYLWENQEPVDGFATVVYDFDIFGCNTSHSQECKIVEGARQITGEESFSIPSLNTDENVLLVSRIHPIHPIQLGIFINDEKIDAQWIPEIPGSWLDIQTRIPNELIRDGGEIRITPQTETGQFYVPAHHQLVEDESAVSPKPDTFIANYQDGHLQLINFDIIQSSDTLVLSLEWYGDGQTTGDYRFFVHLYDDPNQPPIQQWDNYLGIPPLPLGNWLEGTRQDTINLRIDGLQSGSYQLMIGFYNSETLDRLVPTINNNKFTMYDDGRLIIANVEIQ